jgi:hypothetical protein
MKSKLKIADAGNVTVPAFLALEQRGYSVRCERSDDGSHETWIAESAYAELLAENLLALLGLAALAEARGSDWKASDAQIEDFLQKYGYDD